MTREEELRQENVVEAVLFTMGRSVELRQIAVALDTTEEEAKAAVERLRTKYNEENRALQIIELEKSYQMCTKADYYEELIKVAKTPKKQVLTEAVLETLSIIAYKQPITRTEIDKIRGVASDYALGKLIEYGLIYEAGRLDAPGKPILFATTEEFLRRFGIGSKKSLPGMDADREAEIIEEVEKEVNYKFGVEPVSTEEMKADANADATPATVETADSIVEAIAQEIGY